MSRGIHLSFRGVPKSAVKYERTTKTPTLSSELYQTPSLYISDDHLLEVSMILPQDVVLEGREVVAYDPEDPSVVFSPEGFRCNPSAGMGDRGERTCTQRLEMTEAKDAVSVLVVLVYPDGGHLESKLLTYRGESKPRKGL